MDRDCIREWIEGFLSSSTVYDFDVDDSVILYGNLNLAHSPVECIPFKIKSVNGYINISYSNFTSLINFPDVIPREFICSYCDKLKSFDRVSKRVIGDIICNLSIDAARRDPYEYRHLLYTHAQSFKSDDLTLNEIFAKYLHRSDMFHIAIQELMDYGEQLGFHY